jgi:hypothetical protein
VRRIWPPARGGSGRLLAVVAGRAGVEPAPAAHERDESGRRVPRAGCGIRGAARASRRAAPESDLTASNALYVERPTSTTNATTTP